MLRYILLILGFIFGVILLYLLHILFTLMIILRGLFWDFKFHIPDGYQPLTLKGVWSEAHLVPRDVWKELKKGLKL